MGNSARNDTGVIPLSGGMRTTVILFAVLSGILIYGSVFLLVNPITVETDGELVPMAIELKLFLVAVFAVVLLGALKLILGILLRAVTKRGAMTLCDDGIRDTFVIVGFFAFHTLLKVDFIPKDALARTEDGPYVSYLIDKGAFDRVKAGKLTRRILKSTGFRASIGRITAEEFEEYLGG